METYHFAGILTSYYQYIVARWRIARATFFNAGLSTLAMTTFYIFRQAELGEASHKLLLFLIVAGVLLVIMSLIAFTTIDAAKEIRGEQICEFFRQKE